MDKITSYNEIDLTLPGQKPCAYFCCISAQDSSLEFLSSLFFSQLFARLIEYGRRHGKHGRLPMTVNVCLEEFCNIGKLPDFKRVLNFCRGSGIFCQLIVQSIPQLQDRYPKTEWEELIGCTDIQICLGCNDVDTATYISKKCGMVTIKVENNQMPLLPLFSPVYSSTRPYSQTKSNTQRALMLPDEIMRMDNQESLVLLRGQKPLKLYKITPDEHPSFQRLHDVKVSDYTPEWRRQEELAKAERKARAKSRPAPSAPEAGPPPAQPANTAPATPGQKEAGGETAPHKERDQILRQEYDYGLLDPELDRVSSQSPDTEAPYGAVPCPYAADNQQTCVKKEMVPMKAAPITKKPSFPLMKQGDIQNIYHLQMPRWLFTDPRYIGLSLEAKVTYTFLLNRFQLSRLNGWLNDDGEVFIIYTRRSLSSEMQVSYHKIIEAMKELSSAGLIWERRCGRGDANQIYLALVEHRETAGGSAPFVPPEHEAAGGEQPVPAGGSALETGPSGKGRTPPEPHEAQAPPASPRSAGSELLVPAQPEQRGTAAGLEVPGPNFLKSQSGTSRDSETELPEVDQRDSSYIDLNHTDGIHTEFSLSCPSGAGDRMDGLGPWWRNLSEQEQLAQILENCSLWVFDPETAKVFENAIERLFYTQEYRIGKAVLPQANVRSRLWDLDSTILQSVEGKLRQNQRNVKNSTAYTMAVIFNAICESQSDLLLDPYLNSIGGAPAGSEKGGENQCF